MTFHKWRFFEISLLLIIVSYIIYISCTQKQIERENGFGWDGVYYNAMYQRFQEKGADIYQSKDPLFNKTYNKLTTEDPFNKRVMAPYLASKMPFTEVVSFKVLNLLGFFTGFILLFIKWSKNNRIIALILLLYILLTPQMAFRGTLFYPIHVDGVQFFFISLIVFFFNNPKYVFLISIIFLPFKETAVPLCCIYFGSKILWERSARYLIYIIMIILIYFTYLQLLSYKLNISSRSNSIDVITYYVQYYFMNYKNLIKLISCFFIAFSYFIFIKRKFTFNTLFFIFLCSLLALSGSDTTRIFLIALPFLFDEIINSKENNNILLYSSMLLFSIPYKFIFTELTFTDHNKIGDGFFMVNLEYGDIMDNVYFLAYFAFSALFMFIFNNRLLRNYSKKFPTY